MSAVRVIHVRRVGRGWIVVLPSGNEFVFEDDGYVHRSKNALRRAVEQVIETMPDLELGSELSIIHTPRGSQ